MLGQLRSVAPDKIAQRTAEKTGLSILHLQKNGNLNGNQRGLNALGRGNGNGNQLGHYLCMLATTTGHGEWEWQPSSDTTASI